MSSYIGEYFELIVTVEGNRYVYTVFDELESLKNKIKKGNLIELSKSLTFINLSKCEFVEIRRKK